MIVRLLNFFHKSFLYGLTGNTSCTNPVDTLYFTGCIQRLTFFKLPRKEAE